MYTEKVMDIFRKPCNIGEIKDADGVGKIGNPTCGDIMELYIKVGKNKDGEEIIKDIKVKTFGCVAAIATSSILTEMVKGKTLKEARKIGKDDIAKELGGLPPQKLHCSVLAHSALLKAIEDYEKKK
ncbi:iron-sulfur cluster assembly scaffold protein [Candidatus Woesearchaeota archaeon]|nr:iron-sulfur cluster assembly scaffold protein [Candidatus Woesearchaeota archaeon]